MSGKPMCVWPPSIIFPEHVIVSTTTFPKVGLSSILLIDIIFF